MPWLVGASSALVEDCNASLWPFESGGGLLGFNVPLRLGLRTYAAFCIWVHTSYVSVWLWLFPLGSSILILIPVSSG